MQIVVNGEGVEFASELASLEALLSELGIERRRGIAIAVNDSVVPKSKWNQHRLESGDQVEIIRAVQGG